MPLPPEGECKVQEDGDIWIYDIYINKPVGSASVNNGVFTVAIFRKEVPTTLTGKQIFAALMEHYENNGIAVDCILSSWNIRSDNMTKFNQLISEGATMEDAALQTWTGQRAIEYGYTSVEIISTNPPDRPPYTHADVKFFRPI